MITSKQLSKLTYADVIQNMLEGKTFQEQLGISDELMQQFYAISLDYLQEKQYSEASDCFLFMIALNPFESTLWIKSGNAAQCLQDYDEALQAYSMAMFCDADDPFPHLYAAQIYIEQKQLDSARACLDVCLRLIAENPEYAPLHQIATTLRKSFEQH